MTYIQPTKIFANPLSAEIRPVPPSERFEAAARVAAQRSRELWLGLPKGGKTLGGSDEAFLNEAGFTASDKLARVDDYVLTKTTAGDIGVRVFEMKPSDMLENIADGMMDAAIVGLDVLKEFNAASRGQKRLQIVPIADLDLAPCALAIAVRENDKAVSPSDLNGRTIVTKYPAAVENWARKVGITFDRVVKRTGGIESYGILAPGVVIADMVESGASLAVNGWRVLGMEQAAWNDIAGGRRKFSDLSVSQMESIPGVIVASRARLVRASRRMTPDKEAALAALAQDFVQASLNLGKTSSLLGKKVAEQRNFKAGREVKRDGYIPGNDGFRPTWV